MKTILITGINGFLGSHLAKKLSTKYRIIGLEYQLSNLFRLEGCSFEVSLSDESSVRKVFSNQQIDYIIHTATFYGRGSEDISQLTETNLVMPLFLLDMAVKNNVSAFINTDTVLERFVSPYALTKRQFQEWLYMRRNEIKSINMQLEHFFGPGCPATNFITAMITKLKDGVSSIDLTLGEQSRDFIYFEDVIHAYETVLEKIEDLSMPYSEFQVASGEHITIKNLMILLKKLTGSATELNFGALPYRENELMVSQTNITPLLQLGWKPRYTIEEGIQKTL